METQLYSLSKIFTERLFRIPDYQRGYAWGERQLKDFWNDVEQLEDGKNHYTGVLTLEAVAPSIFRTWEEDEWIISSKGFSPFFVVDGQQRLTTSIILIHAITELMPEGVSINYNTRQEIQKKYIFDSRDKGISRSYIFGYIRDNPSYEYLKTKIFCEQSPSALELHETIYTTNLERAKVFFREKLGGLSQSQVESIHKKTTQHLLFNIFTIENDIDVCVSFETMNNRGKKLSYLELLKNRLIYLSLKLDCELTERNTLRRLINNAWKSIYHYLGKNKNAPLDDDKFLRGHMVVYFAPTLVADDQDNLRYFWHYDDAYGHLLLEKIFVNKNLRLGDGDPSRVGLEKIKNYTESLQHSVELWYQFHNPFDSDLDGELKIWLDKLARLTGGEHAPLLIACFQKETVLPKRLILLKALERMLFISSFMSYRQHYAHNSLLRYTIDVATGKSSVDALIKEIEENTQKMLTEPGLKKTAVAEFRRNGFYLWSDIRYFLFEYNLHLQERVKESRKKIFWPEFNEEKSDYVTVEHIFPKHAKDQYWKTRFEQFSPKQRASLRESLGNLLPLSRPKNSSLQNKPFPDKVDGDGEDDIGFRFGSYAENSVAQYPEWGASSILERGMKMLTFLEERWRVQLGNDSDKAYLLGIEFTPGAPTASLLLNLMPAKDTDATPSPDDEY